jgi:hypothetical protein
VEAITHCAQVKSNGTLEESGKFVLNFSQPAQAIGPIQLLEDGRVNGLRSPRYSSHLRLLMQRTLMKFLPRT